MKRDAAIVRLLQHPDVGTQQLGLSLKDSSSRVAWKANLGVDNPGAVQHETIVFCFACFKPTGRIQLQNWSDSSRSSQGSSVQPELFMGDFWNMVSIRVLQEKTHWKWRNKEERDVCGVKNIVSGHKHTGQRFYVQMSPASSYIQPDQMYESKGRHGEEYLPACTVATMKHGGGSIMVRGCMSARGVGHLTVCEGTMNSLKYCQILEHDTLPSAHALLTRQHAQHWILQLDNALCHTARVDWDEWAWSPASGLACTISRHESNRKSVAHHQGSSFWT